jgi:hypothetical protein
MAFRIIALSALVLAAYGCAHDMTKLAAAPPITCVGHCIVRMQISDTVFGCRVTYPAENDRVEVPARRPDGSLNRNVTIVWDAPSGYQFCFAQADGVWFKDKTDQFHTGGATDDVEGKLEASGQCKSKFRWTDVNTATGEFAYRIRFRHKDTDRRCEIDPWVVNR